MVDSAARPGMDGARYARTTGQIRGAICYVLGCPEIGMLTYIRIYLLLKNYPELLNKTQSDI